MVDIGTLAGRIELEDRLTNVLDVAGSAVGRFDESWLSAGQSILTGAASFFTAEAALDAIKSAGELAIETLKEITIEGSHAADISDNFEHLAASAGHVGDTMLGKVRDGVHGLVSDMDIMTRLNQNLAAGLNLTDAQLQLVAKSAYDLSKTEKIDVAEALDRVSDALVTGRTRGVQRLTGMIDLAQAEADYAAKLGTTTDHLNAQGKQAAIQEVVLAKLAAGTARMGDQTERLGDRIQQSKIFFANFEEEVGKAVANSPVLAAGFDAIKSALTEAFGGDREDLVHKIAAAVDNVAIKLIDVAKSGVQAAAFLGQEWEATKVVFGDIAQVISGDVLVFKSLSEAVAEFGSFLHLPGAAESVQRIDNDIQHLMETMVERGAALQKDKAAEEDWTRGGEKITAVLDGIKSKMIDAQKAEGDFTGGVRGNAEAHKAAGDAAEIHGAAEDHLGKTVAMTQEQLKKYNESWASLNSIGASWRDTLMSISPEQQKTIQYYLQAGASVEQLTAAFPNLSKAQIDAVKSGMDYAKVEADAASSVDKAWSGYFAKVAGLYGTTTQKAQAAANQDYDVHVKELQDKGVVDTTYYDQLEVLREKNLKLDDDTRLLQDTHSKTNLEKRIADEKDYYNFQNQHLDQYSQHDRDAQAEVIKNLQAQKDAWGQNADAIDKNTEKVKTLSGEVLTLKEYEARQAAGGSFTYDLSTREGVEQFRKMNPAASITWSDDQIINFAKKGGTLQQLIQMGVVNQYAGYGGNNSTPSFAEGGYGDFGSGTLAMLHGKEIITPIDKVGDMGGGVVNHFYVNGTADDVARKIADVLMNQLKSTKKFRSA